MIAVSVSHKGNLLVLVDLKFEYVSWVTEGMFNDVRVELVPSMATMVMLRLLWQSWTLGCHSNRSDGKWNENFHNVNFVILMNYSMVIPESCSKESFHPSIIRCLVNSTNFSSRFSDLFFFNWWPSQCEKLYAYVGWHREREIKVGYGSEWIAQNSET